MTEKMRAWCKLVGEHDGSDFRIKAWLVEHNASLEMGWMYESWYLARLCTRCNAIMDDRMAYYRKGRWEDDRFREITSFEESWSRMRSGSIWARIRHHPDRMAYMDGRIGKFLHLYE